MKFSFDQNSSKQNIGQITHLLKQDHLVDPLVPVQKKSDSESCCLKIFPRQNQLQVKKLEIGQEQTVGYKGKKIPYTQMNGMKDNLEEKKKKKK